MAGKLFPHNEMLTGPGIPVGILREGAELILALLEKSIS